MTDTYFNTSAVILHMNEIIHLISQQFRDAYNPQSLIRIIPQKKVLIPVTETQDFCLINTQEI